MGVKIMKVLSAIMALLMASFMFAEAAYAQEETSYTPKEKTNYMAIEYWSTFQPEGLEVDYKPSWYSDLGRDVKWMLNYMTQQGGEQEVFAGEVIYMPFIKTPDRGDFIALQAIASLFYRFEHIPRYKSQSYLEAFLSSPLISDGITDDETPIISLLPILLSKQSGSYEFFLKGTEGHIERETLTLPLSGDIRLTLMRYANFHHPNTMNLLKESITLIETIMDKPFPLTDITYILHYDSPGGGHYRYAIMGNAGLELGEEKHISGFMNHENAHYFWPYEYEMSDIAWVHEGIAEWFAYFPENTPDRPSTPHHCWNAKLIDVHRPEGGHHDCTYATGGDFFNNLYLHLGYDAFVIGLRNLWDAMLEYGNQESVPFEWILQTLKDSFPEEGLAIIEKYARHE